MTKYHLNHWSKKSGQTSNSLIAALEIERIYVNADDRSSLGYIERRTKAAERRSASYYDRHRAAKGDTVETVSDEITTTLSADALNRIIEAAIAHNPAYEHLDRYGANNLDVGLFIGLKAFARGINWIADKKRAKELKQNAKLEIEI